MKTIIKQPNLYHENSFIIVYYLNMYFVVRTTHSMGIKLSILMLATLLFSGCSSPSSRYSLKHDTGPDRYINHHDVANAIPRNEPKSKGGNKNYRVNGKSYRVLNSSTGYKQRGIASWYGKKFHGHRTSNGEIYDMYRMTAAHKTLPLPTYVRVTHLKNGRSVILRVNDRGPFHRNRLIDLSYVAAKKLGITATGTGIVEVEAINPTQYAHKKNNKVTQHPVSNTDFKIYLQAGAFSQAQNARYLQDRIQRLGLAQATQVKFDPYQKLYKVRIGPFNNVDTADIISETLMQHSVDKAYIVVD